MARRPTPPVLSPRLSASQTKDAIEKLGRRLRELAEFAPQSVRDRSDSRVARLSTAIDATLADIFGQDSPDYYRYNDATMLDTASHNVVYGTPLHEVIEGLERGKATATALLEQAISHLQERLPSSPSDVASPAAAAPLASGAREVFVVHGHDREAKTEVARLLERAGLKVTILHEQPNGFRTVIEKFERFSSPADFAVVIATPDDVGRGVEQSGTDVLENRARQNVIFEAGFFVGKLGRDKVCILTKGNVVWPSDIAGVVTTPMDNGGAWRLNLLKELRHAGFEVDFNKAL